MNRINYAFLLIAVFVLFGFYSFLLVKFNESYETRAMPEKLQQFEELGKRIVEFYRLQGRFPSSAQELDERSIFLISDPSSGIFIDYSSQRIRYNFEGDGFDLFGSPLHVFSLGLIPANRNFAVEYDIITIKNMAEFKN